MVIRNSKVYSKKGVSNIRLYIDFIIAFIYKSAP